MSFTNGFAIWDTSDTGIDMRRQEYSIDPTARLAPTVRLEVAGDSSLEVGAGSTIAEGVEIEIAEEGMVHVGKRVTIGCNVVMRGHGDIRIEDGVQIDAGVVLDTRETVATQLGEIAGFAHVKRPIRIASGARIGANAVIRAGVSIGAGAIVHPCTYVTDDVADGETVGIERDARRPTTRPPTHSRRFLFGFCRWHETARHFVTLANTLRAANIDSRLYMTPLTGSRLPYLDASQAIFDDDTTNLERVLDDWRPEVVFIWSGATQVDQQVAAAAKARGIECRFAELGWFPQSKTIHFDTEGTNARSSIRRIDLSRVNVDPRFDDWLATRRQQLAEAAPDVRDYVFVPLQDIRDANITKGSPYRSMDDFVSALALQFPNETFVVRPHPNFSDVPLATHPNVIVRRDRSIHPWLQHADAVVGINSTALLEALAYGKPTHAVGTGLATGHDVLFEACDVQSLEIAKEMPANRWERARRLLSELVFVRQAWMKDLHYLDRLAGIYGLGDLLADNSSTPPATSTPISAVSAQF